MRVVPRRGKRRADTPAKDAKGRPSAADRPPVPPPPDSPEASENAPGSPKASGKGPGSPEVAGKGSGVSGKGSGSRNVPEKAPDSPSASGKGLDSPGASGKGPGSPGASGRGPGAPGTSGKESDSPDATGKGSGGDTATRPLDRRAAERARRADALRRVQEQRRARAGRGRHKAARSRPALLALVITLGVLIAAVAVTGTLIATSREEKPMPLAAPLHVYPVTQVVSGACPAGTQGITGQTVSGPACYQLSSGIAIRRVTELRVQQGQAAGTHDVAISLSGTDRQAFAGITRQTVGRTVAFVVRDQLVTAPRVDMPITDGKVVVTGRFTKSDADRLVRTLKGS
ncbi:hypothetical protein SAMN04489712_104321 [Thermomonospora echinospora]|uniref:SecDF P1 head subdomain domain-containing protein n=1 Tax=Thermomonospora echinospora TaxID=1992 RepID=A0A1H5Z332_9ACTN|nr:hypothetical protein [Thermomonospora echinospora]SEG30721.1 hypothetical protein SAMN04489712_104321 [Thermomonospora echinospora]